MIKLISNLKRCSKGATAIEYGLITALIAVSIIVVVSSIGTEIGTTLGIVDSTLETANQ